MTRFAPRLVVALLALYLLILVGLRTGVTAQLGSMILQASDYATGSTVQWVGDAKRRAIRVVTAQDDPVVAAIGQLRQRLALFGLITQTGGAMDVNVKYAPAYWDPCQGRKSKVAISQTGGTVLMTQLPGRIHICGIFALGADAENLSLVEGTGSTCGTNTLAMLGGSTAANGPNFGAGAGWVEGFANADITSQSVIGNDVCLLQSGAGRVAGNLSYVVDTTGK